jgi:hypothetical protein
MRRVSRALRAGGAPDAVHRSPQLIAEGRHFLGHGLPSLTWMMTVSCWPRARTTSGAWLALALAAAQTDTSQLGSSCSAMAWLALTRADSAGLPNQRIPAGRNSRAPGPTGSARWRWLLSPGSCYPVAGLAARGEDGAISLRDREW